MFQKFGQNLTPLYPLNQKIEPFKVWAFKKKNAENIPKI